MIYRLVTSFFVALAYTVVLLSVAAVWFGAVAVLHHFFGKGGALLVPALTMFGAIWWVAFVRSERRA